MLENLRRNSTIFSDQDGMKLEIKRKVRRSTNMWKLNNFKQPPGQRRDKKK